MTLLKLDSPSASAPHLYPLILRGWMSHGPPPRAHHHSLPLLFFPISGFSSGHLSLRSLPPSSAPGHLSRKETLGFYLLQDAVSSAPLSVLQTGPDSTCHVSSCTLSPKVAQKLLTSRGQVLHDSQMAMAMLGIRLWIYQGRVMGLQYSLGS